MFGLTDAELAAIRLSLTVSVWSTVLMLIPGVLMGWLLARKQFPGKSLIDAVVHLPMVLPPVVPGYVLLLLMGNNGPLGAWLERVFGWSFAFNWKGAVLAAAVMAFPLLVQAVRLSIQVVDKRLEYAARTLGAGPIRAFFTVVLPLAAPGVLMGAILAFSRSLGEFGATMTFVGNIAGETRTLPLAIYTAIHVPDGDAIALRLTLISVVIALFALWGSNVLSRRMERWLGIGAHAGF